MLKKFFWSKYMTWFRKFVQCEKPDLPWEEILNHPINHPIYTMGSADPRCTTKPTPPGTSYNPISGVDIKTYFEDTEGNFISLAEVQMVTAKYRFLGCDDSGKQMFGDVRGGIETILFDQDALANLPFDPQNILLVAVNEYGYISYTKFFDVELLNTRWQVSIDDIVSGATTEFTALSCTPWKTLNGPTCRKDWKESIDRRIQDNLRKFV